MIADCVVCFDSCSCIVEHRVFIGQTEPRAGTMYCYIGSVQLCIRKPLPSQRETYSILDSDRASDVAV